MSSRFRGNKATKGLHDENQDHSTQRELLCSLADKNFGLQFDQNGELRNTAAEDESPRTVSASDQSNQESSENSSSESVQSVETNNTSSSSSNHSNVFSGPSPKLGISNEDLTQRKNLHVSNLVRKPIPIQARRHKIQFTPIFRYLLVKMVRFTSKYHKEISLMFFLIASALSLVKKGPAKIQTSSSPRPFFPAGSARYLQDNYNGDYVELARRTIPFVPTFVFYYAPWDSESLDARNEFMNVAHYFYNTEYELVKFVAVNCWYLNGQCRQNYKNLSHFPIFVMHVMSPTGVIYSGPIRSHLMIRFIHLALQPMTRLDSEDNFWTFRSQHDVLLLSYFNFTDPNASRSYETYRQVALRHLEADSFGQVGFGVILKPELAEKYFLTSSSNTISLVLFNEIHTAKWASGFLENDSKGDKGPVGQVIEWLGERTKKLPITWIYPVRNGFANRPIALGPIDLSKEIMNGPIFLLITKRYYPSSYSPFYNQVKEVALDYFNCNLSGNVTKLRRTLHKLNSEWIQLWKSITEICLNSNQISFNCKVMLPQLEHWEKKKMYYLKDSISNYDNISRKLNFTGLSCASKRQFRFIAVDPIDIPHFTDLALGLKQQDFVQPCSEDKNHSCDNYNKFNGGDPLGFIIDAQNEVLMPFTKFNISELAKTIHNFTMETENKTNNIPWSSHLIVESSKLTDRIEPENQLVKKFNSSMFLEHLEFMNNSISDKTSTSSLFLMYTAQFCGFCNVVLTQFLSLAKFLENYNLNITLGKIDTFKNSLPSTLNSETIPSFVLYSTTTSKNSTTNIVTRGIDSRLFPSNQEITTRSLLRFLLSELDPKARVNLSLIATAQTCSKESAFTKSDCLKKNKASVTSQIQSFLEKLVTELGLVAKKEIISVGNEFNESVDNNTLTFQLLRPITLWETELLDHLRSVKLTLDVTK